MLVEYEAYLLTVEEHVSRETVSPVRAYELRDPGIPLGLLALPAYGHDDGGDDMRRDVDLRWKPDPHAFITSHAPS